MRLKRLYTDWIHGFRLPLQIILAATEQMCRYPRQPPEKQLELIRQNSQELLARIERLLCHAEIEG